MLCYVNKHIYYAHIKTHTYIHTYITHTHKTYIHTNTNTHTFIHSYIHKGLRLYCSHSAPK